MNLRLLQLGDSALPIGGYSHSWGLEAAISQGLVGEPVGLEQWVRDWLFFALGPLEGVTVATAFRAASNENWQEVREINEVLAASLIPEALRQASRDMGAQLLALAERWPWAQAASGEMNRFSSEQSWHYAPVFGALASLCSRTCADGVGVYLHQAALGMISAGVRAIPIGHTHGQQILARLQDEIAGLAGDLAVRELEVAGSSCPAYEVLCHDQSKLYTRLFRS